MNPNDAMEVNYLDSNLISLINLFILALSNILYK